MAADLRLQSLDVARYWIEAHCVVPDGPRAGERFALYQYQRRYIGNFYLVRPDARPDQEAPAFVHRRGLLVGPQGLGKNPLIAAQSLLEFVGPALFAGWAGKDEGYSCREHGCPCGWEYPYDEGEPTGRHWATPLIQITAFSVDSTENTYDALRPMVKQGPLGDILLKVGEDFIRHPSGHDGSRIDTVTSSDRSRLGARATFVPQDELGLWTASSGMVKLADTQYRNLSKMGGRASLTTNAWDPSQNSVAQRECDSDDPGVYRQFDRAPASLSFGDKRERRKIYRAVYPDDTRRENGGHVDLDAIDGEAAPIYAKDPAQAERFYGNMLVQGSGQAFDIEVWTARAAGVHDVAPGRLITLGIDGSKYSDHTSLIATDVAAGYQWPLGIWRPEDHGGAIPKSLVRAAVGLAFSTFDVWRLYGDPAADWDTLLDEWASDHGPEHVLKFPTNGIRMWLAYRSWENAQRAGDLSHCPIDYSSIDHATCELFTWHVGNAVRHETNSRDRYGVLWYPAKPNQRDKIDSVPAAVLSWQARNDAIAAGALNVASAVSVYEERGLLSV